MNGLAGPALLLLLLLLTLCLSSAEEPDTLVVRYKQQTMTPGRGSSVKLSCEAYYDPEKCGLVHVEWLHSSRENAALTDPWKYLTTVNETEFDHNMRRRQVVTEILDLRRRDGGVYQCRAECGIGNESAMGHFITISVRG